VLTRIADADGLRIASALAGHASEITTLLYLKKAPPFAQQEEALMRGKAR
jgi:hypothetical protein